MYVYLISRRDFEKYPTRRTRFSSEMTFTFLIKATLLGPVARHRCVIFFNFFSPSITGCFRIGMPPGSTRGKSTNASGERDSGNDNFAWQRCKRDIIAYCVQFANGPRTQDDSSSLLAAAFTHSSGDGYTIINPVRYYVTDDGLPRPCPRDDSSASTRSTWSIEINDRPLDSLSVVI